MIADEGIAAATTRRIADEAGVPVGLVHYWFAGKDDLLAAVVAQALVSIRGAADASVGTGSSSTSLFERLRAAFRAVEQDDVGRQIGLYEMTTWALRRPSTRDLARDQYSQYRQVAAQATKAWLRDAALRFDGDPDVLAQFTAVLFDGLVLAWLADPDGTDVDGVLRLVSRMVEGQVSQVEGPSSSGG